MKKEKDENRRSGKFREALGDMILELFVGGVFLGIGMLVYWLFGKKIDWDTADPETIAFVGFIAVVIIGFAVWLLHKFFKKKK